MPSKQKLLLILAKSLVSLAVLAGGVAIFLALGVAKTDSGVKPAKDVGLVQVRPAQAHNEGISFRVDGVVVPYREVEIASEVAARIIKISENLRPGKVVRKGEPLVMLDRRDYELDKERLQEELMQAQGNIIELEVQIESAKAQVELASQNLEIQTRSTDRIRRLVERNATTESSLDSALRDELAAQTSLQSQRDQLALLKATVARLENARNRTKTQLSIAELQLSRTTITSPIDGVVVSDTVEVDSFLQKGTLICTIRDTSRLEIKCSLQAYQMKWLWESSPQQNYEQSASVYEFPPTPATVFYEVGQDTYSWEGQLSRYDGAQIDQQTRMIPCRVSVENPLKLKRVADQVAINARAALPTLMVGMYVEVDVHVNPQARLVRIPVTAMYPGNKVWVASNGELSKREVAVAVADKDSVLVYAGATTLQPNEQVVVSPLASPYDGQKVEIAE